MDRRNVSLKCGRSTSAFEITLLPVCAQYLVCAAPCRKAPSTPTRTFRRYSASPDCAPPLTSLTGFCTKRTWLQLLAKALARPTISASPTRPAWRTSARRCNESQVSCNHYDARRFHALPRLCGQRSTCVRLLTIHFSQNWREEGAQVGDQHRHSMSELYPFLMMPLFDPRPWGTHDLSPVYPKTFDEKIGESWLTGDHCKVQNGPLAERSLGDLASEYERELVGEAPADQFRFPLLAKFLFPHEKLSVQVHPDDEDARSIGQPWGKTECWYVVHAEPK